MHPDQGYCLGCMRTIEEISDWLDMRDEEKRELIAKLEQRRAAAA